MADVCPACHTGETQPGLDRSMCLNCGAFFYTNEDGDSVVTDADAQLTDNVYDGPLEPETKGGRGLPTSSMGASTESALQQEGALPQHGIPGIASDEQRTAYDTPDGFTAPAAFNERLDPLAEGLANATTRVEEIEVVEMFIESGEAPQVVAKADSQNADALGSPVARAPLNPVHDDTASTGASDEQPVLAQVTTQADTPTDNPDSLPADKTAEQKATGEAVTPAPAPEPGAADVVGQPVDLPENPPVVETPVAQPFAENATPNPSQTEPAALDTPDVPKDDHDPAQNTVPSDGPNPPADTAPVEGTH